MKCKVLYQRDYLNLLIKYGLEEPSQGSLLERPDDGATELGLFDEALGHPA